MENTGQISYSAANMPAVETQLIDGPGRRCNENVIDCRWLLRCSDDTLVPRVTFSTFATENNHDYVRVWVSGTGGSEIRTPTAWQICMAADYRTLSSDFATR